MRVGVDNDGVLYDFGNSVRRYLHSIGREFGWKGDQSEPHHWDFYKYWGMTRQEFTQVCHDGVDAGYIFSGGIRPGAKEAMERITKMGAEIVIITDRSFGSSPKNSERATIDWLTQHDIWFDELIFSPNKTIVKTDIFVEDKYENAIALRNAGTECWLINRPWNTNFDYDKRIDDISDFPEKVEQFASLSMV